MPDQSYTLAEAAAKIGVRDDTLVAMLPDYGIDIAARSPQTLTQAELDRLSEIPQRLKAVHSEGVN